MFLRIGSCPNKKIPLLGIQALRNCVVLAQGRSALHRLIDAPFLTMRLTSLFVNMHGVKDSLSVIFLRRMQQNLDRQRLPIPAKFLHLLVYVIVK